MIPVEGAEPQFLQFEGDMPYKSFMRQGVWNRTIDGRGSEDEEWALVDIMNANEDMVQPSSLRSIYGTPATRSELTQTLVHLHENISKVLKTPVDGIAVGYPAHLPEKSREFLRGQLHLHVPSIPGTTAPRPWLIASESDLADGGEEPNILFLDMSAASLEMAIIEIWSGVADVSAYAARPDLGEDAIALGMINLVAEDFSPQQLGGVDFLSLKTQLQRSWERWDGSMEAFVLNTSSLPFDHTHLPQISSIALRDFEDHHFAKIQRSLEDFLIKNEYIYDPYDGSAHHVLRSKLVGIMLVGDASEKRFAAMEDVLSRSRSFRNITVLDNGGVPPSYAGARAAARRAHHYMVAIDNQELCTLGIDVDFGHRMHEVALVG